jgi:PPOX class probable F420-dependent enzyme
VSSLRIDQDEMRRRVAEARVARVGTLDEDGRVHLVPVVFAVDGDTLYSTSDAGPRPVKRVRNLERDPRVTVLVDVYDEDWPTVWWVRVRGTGRTVETESERDRAWRLLREKYPQYERTPPSVEGARPMMAVDVEDWSGWAYS